MKNRGVVLEVLTVLIVIFIFCVMAVIGKTVYDKIGDKFAQSTVVTPEALEAYQQYERGFTIMDNMAIFLVLSLTVGLIITSFLIPTHPIFIIINILGTIFLAFLSMVLSNVYFSLTESDVLVSSSAYFTKMAYIMQWLPYVCVGVVLLASVANFARGKINGE